MKVELELYTAQASSDGSCPLVIRFSVNRKTYRYRTGTRMTASQFGTEKTKGYVKAFEADKLHTKAKKILSMMDLKDFNIEEFNRMMNAPDVAKDPVTKWFDEYLLHRNKQRLKSRTRGLDVSAIKKIKPFLEKNPKYNDVYAWDRDQLNELFDYMTDKEREGHVEVASAGIYLRTFSAFFTWLINEKDFIMKDPFRMYKIPKYRNSWFPYSNSELYTILNLKPKTERQERALKWVKMIVYSGGTDMKDFAEMTWRQVHSEVIQMIRVKVEDSSDSAKKLLYISPKIREVFDQLKTKRGKQDDYVFGIYKKDKSEDQNLEFHKANMNNINDSMNEMLADLNKEREKKKQKPVDIHFTIKRLRPTAATVANNSTKDLNYVKYQMQHANLKQTDTYVKNTPSDVMKASQEVFEEALLKIEEGESSEKSVQHSTAKGPSGSSK